MDIFQIFSKKNKVNYSGSLICHEYYLNTYEDIKAAGISPKIHFFEFGWKEKRNPSFLFDTHYYVQSQNLDSSINPIDHYSKNGNKPGVNPHPDFDTEFYLSQVGVLNETPLEHFYKVGIKERIKPSLDFSFVMIEKRRDGLQTFYPSESSSVGENNFSKTLDSLDEKIPTIICMSHEASRTGAPLIILNIASQLKNDYAFQIINIVGYSGVLNDDFFHIGPTLVLQNFKNFSKKVSTEEIEYYVDMIQSKNLKVIGGFINSAESRKILEPISVLDIPIYSLIHEMGHLYPRDEFSRIFEFSDMVVFPCNAVKLSAEKNTSLPEERIIVRGQGLLKPNLLKDHKETARLWLRSNYNLPSDAFIILGCGSMVLRKGYDLFVKTAIEVVEKDKSGRIYFMWLGGEHEAIKQDYKWTFLDLEKTNSSDRVLFVGAHDDTTYFFAGSDVFFLSSREDPFPCVIHEAMACKLPIISYRKSGGTEELVETENIGELVEYASIQSGVDAILDIFSDEQKYLKYSNNAYKAVVEKFDYSSYVDYLLDNMLQNFYEIEEIKSFGLDVPVAMFKEATKKVIFTLPGWGLSGVNTFIELLIKYLNQNGYDAKLLFTVAKKNIQDSSLIPDIPHEFLEVDAYDYAERLKKLEEYINGLGVCIFVPNYDYLASSLSPSLKNNVGILGVLHSDDVEHYEHAYRLGAYWNRIVCVSKEIERKLLKINLSFKEQTSVIHYGIEKPKLEDSVKNQKFTIIYSGRISTFQKRILDYYDIIASLKRKTTIPFVVKFFGDGPQMQEFMALMEPFDKEGLVEIHGRVDRDFVFQELSKAHVFSLISEFEGLSLSLLEAMNLGCVPVMYQIDSGMDEVLTDNYNGLIIENGNIEAYTDSLISLMQDEIRLKTFSNNAVSSIEEKGLFVKDMGVKYAKLINEIFFELKTKRYKRPKILTHNPGTKGVLLPPNLQKI